MPNPTTLINSATGRCFSYSEFTNQTKILAASLQNLTGLSKGDTAFILSPNSTEISRQIKLSKAVIVFVVSSTCHKLPTMRYRTILIDSPEFESVLSSSSRELCPASKDIFSSATGEGVTDVVAVYGALFSCIWVFDSVKSVALSETVVLMERVTDVAVAVALPVLVTMAKGDVTDGYDLRLLVFTTEGSSPLFVYSAAFWNLELIRFVFQVGDKTREDVDYSEEEIDRGFQEFAVGSSYVQDTREVLCFGTFRTQLDPLGVFVFLDVDRTKLLLR
ncbi:unnamed protein product [Ilex paraguariensis]|uniref:AMP-dependent synthetase/ligase domain-containing protein n=1 Tax=Ilex paraguariensis TaxID=185542 RepID=A0ABC8UV32_9AQUA